MVDYNIGAKIKELRRAKKLTLQAVATETGFSTALISQIENNNISPPIATLSRLADYFGVKIGIFFSENEEECRFDLVRRNERTIIPKVVAQDGTNHGYFYESLSRRKYNKKMEPFILTLNEKVMDTSTYSHDGEEFLFIMQGTAELLLDEQRITLERRGRHLLRCQAQTSPPLQRWRRSQSHGRGHALRMNTSDHHV